MAVQTKELRVLLSTWREAEAKPVGTDASESAERARQRDAGLALALLQHAAQVTTAGPDEEAATVWQEYLEATGRPRFLRALPDRASRELWAHTALGAIRAAGYTIESMLASGARDHPDRPYLRETTGGESRGWSYARVREHTRAIAAGLRSLVPTDPRVAIFAENCFEGACADLACLAHGIFVTPLDVHFSAEILAGIFDRLGINLAITDGDERRARLEDVRARTRRPFTILHLDPAAEVTGPDDQPLAASWSRLSSAEIDATLAASPRFGLDDVATAMFTSGSTGVPKGVCFTLFNLVSKRFSRAAALPCVGDDEVLLCYLPLYHTFGRYLELQGSLFWRGTYVFAGNPSAETLLALLPQVQPTALIGIPLRWQQVRDRCAALMQEATGAPARAAAFREVVGGRLRWGLSAAGYLDPKVFDFFQRHGVDLCSGFGMTEATGGITMTPPGAYRENSVGLPLPGVRIRLGDQGELQIAGPYIARYLDDTPPMAPGIATRDSNPADKEPAPPLPESIDVATEYWLATGDLFETRADGYLEIVDRIKDIYKNVKGQTVAPRRVEQRFAEVPGIKRVFLVGDGRAYNVLLIVPDVGDPIIRDAPSAESVRQYCRQLVTAANKDLAPYERIVNFALLDRDFSVEQGELTPKASYKRKVIEAHFAPIIQELYQSDSAELLVAGVRVRIPRWLFRDLGVVEDDIVAERECLHDRQSGRRLCIRQGSGDGLLQVGDLEYRPGAPPLDLGLFARQPLLWLGNPSLVAFCPCKEGWDIALGSVAADVYLPWRTESADPAVAQADHGRVRDPRLAELHRQACRMLFAPAADALAAVEAAGSALRQTDDRAGRLIRRRLEALARHPDLRVRSLAYRVLLLDEPVPETSEVLPAFVEAGLPFLSAESIEAIARTDLEPRRLEALRQRLRNYRRQLSWPATTAVRVVFTDIFTLLANFARYHPAYYAPVREELACWLLHRADPELAEAARRRFDQLADWYEAQLAANTPHNAPENWAGKIVCQEDLTAAEVRRLELVLIGTTFLKESIQLVFDGENFDLREVPPDGIWISRILTWLQYHRYRVGVNTVTGRHYDLQIIVREDITETPVLETIHRMVAITGYPYGPSILPKFGCCRPELGVYSLAYVSDLTVWEKIREFSSLRLPGGGPPVDLRWRKLFVRAMSAFFVGWHNSEGQIVPGAVTPTNIVVPEPDFREASLIMSLTGWKPYRNTLSLVGPLIRNFFLRTAAYYPWCAPQLDYRWIFDACAEALGLARATSFLGELREDLGREPVPGDSYAISEALDRYLTELRERFHVPLTLQCAIDRYREWEAANPGSTAAARGQLVGELYRLYRLDRWPEIARYHLYRHTYFAHAAADVRAAMDQLLCQIFAQPGRPATRMVELSDLQALLGEAEDRIVFSRLVFPRARAAQKVEVLAIGENGHRQVIVRSQVVDRLNAAYEVREPLEPSELGIVYRLFYRAGFPKSISEHDRIFVVEDVAAEIVGGVCYKIEEPTVVHLDGIVVTSALRGRGITTSLLEDFCLRLASQGVRVVKTHFFLRQFYLRHGFQVDPRWGGLVRFLAS